jgi:hypothetical protein
MAETTTEQTEVQGTAVPEASQAIQEVVGGLVNQPQAVPGSAINPTLINQKTGEAMVTSGVTNTLPTILPQNAVLTPQTATVGQSTTAAGTMTTPTATQMTVDTTGAAAQAQAAQMNALTQPAVGASGSITQQATVQGQLANITQDIEASLAAGTP